MTPNTSRSNHENVYADPAEASAVPRMPGQPPLTSRLRRLGLAAATEYFIAVDLQHIGWALNIVRAPSRIEPTSRATNRTFAIQTSTDRSRCMITPQQAHPVTSERRRRTSIALMRPGVFCAVWVTVGFLTLLCLSDTALAAARQVVPPSGKLAGETSSYWLKRSWQTVFNSSAPVDPCQWLTAHGQRVRYLTLTTIAPGTDNYTCNEPAGQPTYVVGLSNECSTFHKDHGMFGTTDSALKRCARALFRGVHQTTTIGGRPLDPRNLLASTGAYPVQAAHKNILGLPAGNGRAAAHGYGLMLTGLAKGSHTIRTRASIGSATWDITFNVRAH
jgi:hypothetical protein